jgi:hypothetical protein
MIPYFTFHFRYRYKRASYSITNLSARSAYYRGGNTFRPSEKIGKRAGTERWGRFCGMLLSSLLLFKDTVQPFE